MGVLPVRARDGDEEPELVEGARAFFANEQVSVARDAGGHTATQVTSHHPAVIVGVDELDGASPTGLFRERTLRTPVPRVEKLGTGRVDALSIEKDRAAVDCKSLKHRGSAGNHVLGAAIRALGESCRLDGKIDARMAVP